MAENRVCECIVAVVGKTWKRITRSEAGDICEGCILKLIRKPQSQIELTLHNVKVRGAKNLRITFDFKLLLYICGFNQTWEKSRVQKMQMEM